VAKAVQTQTPLDINDAPKNKDSGQAHPCALPDLKNCPRRKSMLHLIWLKRAY